MKLEGKHISEAIIDANKIIEGRKTGIIRPLITPWPKLNRSTMGGIEFGSLLTLSGMSSSGKTAFASQLYRQVHELNPTQDFIIIFFTFEMTASKLLIRDAIANTKIRRDDLLSANGETITAQQESSVFKYYESVKHKPIFFIEVPKTAERYVEICREYHDKYNKNILAISDHSLLFKGNEGGDREMLVGLAKDIMKQKNEGWCAHILLTQLNREIESPARRAPCSPLNYPDKGCLTSSDSIYQASDYVLIIHRPHILKFIGPTYGPDKLETDVKNLYGHLVKNRDGEPAIFKWTANFAEMCIIDN